MNDNLTRWVEALRSGYYQQSTGSLCQSEKTEEGTEYTGYCCLGVAEVLRLMDPNPMGGLPHAELAEWLGIELDPDALDSPDEWDLRIAVPSTITADQLRDLLDDGDVLTANYQKLLHNIQHTHQGITATSLNDEYLLSFKQIANLIEQFGIYEENDAWL